MARRITGIAITWRGQSKNFKLVHLVSPFAHGCVEMMARVAKLIFDSLVASLVVNLSHAVLQVFGVCAEVKADGGTALPGVDLVVPAVVIKLDLPVNLGIASVKISLQAEISESTLVHTVLVDTAALV